MDATPAPATPQSGAGPIGNAAIAAGVYADSIDSSPRSRRMESSEADPALAPPQKLRLMCSYGGHIVPRPHDKTLCYVGGDTRIIVIDRHTSLSDLHNRLSKTLLHNQSFLLKYQLPNEDLDSLISVATDEDLENMVEEYDRVSNGGGVPKQGRLRLFLFPKSQSNVEQLLAETGSAKSEDWFFNALNGKASTVSGGCASDRGFSESSSINNLLGFDEDPVGKGAIGGKDGETQVEDTKVSGIGSGNCTANHDVHSVPGSPMVDTTSSFGSSNSSPSMVNLPPIKVHVDQNPKVGVVGIEDQFQQVSVAEGGGNANVPLPHKPEELGIFVAPAEVAPGFPAVIGGEYAASRVFSDDERPEDGGHARIQHAQLQLPQHPVAQILQKSSGVTDLASPDSVSSEGSARNTFSRQMHVVYQEPVAQIPLGNGRATPSQDDIKNGEPNNVKYQVQPHVQEHGYILSGQLDQNFHALHHPQHFVHAGNQYIPAGAVPISSYYPVYAHQSQHLPHQSPVNQPYPIYIMPGRPNQAYNLQPQQPTYSELPHSVPQTAPPASAAHQVAYASTIGGPSSKPELPTGVYTTAAGGAQQLVQLSSGQHQTQYVGFSQTSHPNQTINPIPGINAPFTYGLVDPARPQMYYTQYLPPQSASHYHTLTTAPAAVMPNTSSPLPTENMKHPVKTPQP